MEIVSKKDMMSNQIKIFIVDDDEFSLNMYAQFLRNNGFENIALINEGEKCLARLQEHPVIIFLDHQMQDLSGMETLQKIRKYSPHIKVVIVSAQENIRMAVSFIKNGAYDYIVKGDDEMLRMKTILKKLASEEEETDADIETERSKKKYFANFDSSSLLIVLVALLMFIGICGLVVYYYLHAFWMGFVALSAGAIVLFLWKIGRSLKMVPASLKA